MLKKLPFPISETLRQIMSEQRPGSWVAISLERKSVVGLGPSSEEAKRIAKAEGEAQVILLRVPTKRAELDFRSGADDAT